MAMICSHYETNTTPKFITFGFIGSYYLHDNHPPPLWSFSCPAPSCVQYVHCPSSVQLSVCPTNKLISNPSEQNL